MPNHKNMFGIFYGNSSRSGNSTSSRGMGTRRSRNGGVTIGNGNLVQRRSGRGGMMNGGVLRELNPQKRLFPCNCTGECGGSVSVYARTFAGALIKCRARAKAIANQGDGSCACSSVGPSQVSVRR